MSSSSSTTRAKFVCVGIQRRISTSNDEALPHRVHVFFYISLTRADRVAEMSLSTASLADWGRHSLLRGGGLCLFHVFRPRLGMNTVRHTFKHKAHHSQGKWFHKYTYMAQVYDIHTYITTTTGDIHTGHATWKLISKAGSWFGDFVYPPNSIGTMWECSDNCNY